MVLINMCNGLILTIFIGRAKKKTVQATINTVINYWLNNNNNTEQQQ